VTPPCLVPSIFNNSLPIHPISITSLLPLSLIILFMLIELNKDRTPSPTQHSSSLPNPPLKPSRRSNSCGKSSCENDASTPFPAKENQMSRSSTPFPSSSKTTGQRLPSGSPWRPPRRVRVSRNISSNRRGSKHTPIQPAMPATR
jgi:hypothetical protein